MPCTPAIIMVMDMRPGMMTVREVAGHQVQARQEVAEDQHHQDGLGEGGEHERGALRRGHEQVAPQEGQEGGHSRSSFPVRWM